jgi:hypothetical protein
MATLDFESDPQMITLTDALRAGPGSPQWREAVARVREQGGDQADEYLLLCTAREHLASGRSYREIHAGPRFTRKVMESVEQEGDGKPPRVAPSASAIALISAAVVIAVVASAGYLAWRGGGAPKGNGQDLSQIYFTENVLDVSFDAMPNGWRTVGVLPLKFENGLHAGDAPAGRAEFVGGALLWEQSVLPSKAMQIDATLRVPAPESKLVAQIFVTDDPTLSDARATSPHELAWTYRGGAATIALPSGRVEAATVKPAAGQQMIDLRIQFDAQSVAIDTAGQRLWAGAHGLDGSKPRFIGIRFLAPAGEKADPAAAFASIRLKKPRS